MSRPQCFLAGVRLDRNNEIVVCLGALPVCHARIGCPRRSGSSLSALAFSAYPIPTTSPLGSAPHKGPLGNIIPSLVDRTGAHAYTSDQLVSVGGRMVKNRGIFLFLAI